jgi:hypothetical protein
MSHVTKHEAPAPRPAQPIDGTDRVEFLREDDGELRVIVRLDERDRPAPE